MISLFFILNNNIIIHKMTDTFYWNYSGQHHEFSDMFELLTVGLLEESPEDYLELLRLSSQWDIGETRKILDDTSSEKGWYSPHPTCLSYLVGDQPDSTKSRASNSSPYSWFGQHQSSVSEDLGIEIFKEMILCGSDLSIKDFYNEDIKDFIEKTSPSLTYREKNSRFKELVIFHYNQQQ